MTHTAPLPAHDAGADRGSAGGVMDVTALTALIAAKAEAWDETSTEQQRAGDRLAALRMENTAHIAYGRARQLEACADELRAALAEPDALTITVHGTPAGQGAIRYGKHGHGYHANGPALRAWRAKVKTAALQAGAKPLDGPVALDVVVTVAALKTPRPYPHTRRTADADHYLRAIGDALSTVAYGDDSQICDARIRVVYPGPPGLDQPGAVIRVWPLEVTP